MIGGSIQEYALTTLDCSGRVRVERIAEDMLDVNVNRVYRAPVRRQHMVRIRFAGGAMGRQLVLKGATVFTGTGELLSEGSILVSDGRIQDVAAEVGHQPDADVLDMTGKFVMSGFIDAHTHLSLWAPHERDEFQIETPFYGARAAREMLASGVTTVRDVGGVNHFDIALRNAIAKGQVAGPRMLVAGRFIAPTGGHVHYWARRADGVDEVRKAVREQILAGVDLIKLMASGGAANVGENPDRMNMRREEIEAATEEAREAGKRVSVHAHPAKAIRTCAEVGVTSVEHAKGLDEETIESVLRHDMWIVPTQAVYKRMADNIDGLAPGVVEISRKVVEEKLPTLKNAIKAGVKIGIGTDCGRHFPHSHFVGEMMALHDVGMTTEQVLLAATKGNAELLGVSEEIGTLEPGKKADLVVLDGNPIQDLKNGEKVEAVIQGGRVLTPEALLQIGLV
jgi:imidazolonepropionase-like amidohydrolase